MDPKERPYEQKACPRCGKNFVCSASAKCWCFEIDLPTDTLEMIQAKWDGCLCPECLKSYTKAS